MHENAQKFELLHAATPMLSRNFSKREANLVEGQSLQQKDKKRKKGKGQKFFFKNLKA